MPIPIDRDHLRQLLGGAAQLVEVLPAEEYVEEHLPGRLTCPSNSSTAALSERLTHPDASSSTAGMPFET